MEVVGAVDVALLGRGGEHHGRHPPERVAAPHPLEDLEAGPARELQVEEHQARRRARLLRAGEPRDRRVPVLRDLHGVRDPVPLERALDEDDVVLVILDEQDGLCHSDLSAGGRVRMKRLPRPSSETTRTSPPDRSMILRTMASPTPVPS